MQEFSTIIFIDGNPVGYKVYHQPHQINFNPAERPGRAMQPPALKATLVNGEWKVEGTDNQKLIAQVLQDLNVNNFLPAQMLSATP